MTDPTTVTCPECAGPQLSGHIKGLLTFDHDRAACSLGRAEDSTADADQRRAAGWLGSFARPMTDTEWTLLLVIGVDPDGLSPWTHLTVVSPGVLRRNWIKRKVTAA